MPEKPDAADLTVGQAAAALGVTVRTLHHWDEIGLASPSLRSAAGYRRYAPQDMERLQRVVVYRELGVGLEAIHAILEDSSTAVIQTLRAQQAQLTERIEHLTALNADLSRMIQAHDHGSVMSAQEQKQTFGPDWDPRWPAQAHQQYGHTPQWAQYAERVASRTRIDWQTTAQATSDLNQELAAAMDAGLAPGSDRAAALVERHREVFSAYFPLTRQMQVILGRMYEADPRYAAHYEAVRPGLSSWLRLAIDASAHTYGIDPDTARWQ